MLTICNEPVKPLQQMRSPRIWQTIFSPDLNGKIALSEIQLNHALASEENQDLDKRLLVLYAATVQKFAKLHGENTRCFLARAPESLTLVGQHTRDSGGSTNGIAFLETLFCVSPRSDGLVTVAHLDERFGSTEFDLLEGLPKARVLNWGAHIQEVRVAAKSSAQGNAHKNTDWCGPVKRALQYYVNRHKGPTGQIELNIPGLNIVVGSMLPQGAAGHSETTLAAAALAAIMTASGEWGQLPLCEFADWLNEAQAGSHGRKSDIGPVVFGMPGEVIHTDWNPARSKGKALPHGFSFLTAHTALQPVSHGTTVEKPKVDVFKTVAVRSTTTAVAMELFRQAAREETIALNDESLYRLVRQVPENATRGQILELVKSAKAKSDFQERFEKHPEPEGGYNLREKLLFVLGEMRRADRATSAIRGGDAAGLGALMNIGQAGEATVIHDVTALGQVRAMFEIPSCVSDEELHAREEDNSALWRESGRSGASTHETDLLCDIANVVPGVLGARYVEPQRVAILCKTEAVQLVKDALVGGYYSPRGLPVTLVEQVYPCQGVGIFAV